MTAHENMNQSQFGQPQDTMGQNKAKFLARLGVRYSGPGEIPSTTVPDWDKAGQAGIGQPA
jgi:hypothetical protein